MPGLPGWLGSARGRALPANNGALRGHAPSAPGNAPRLLATAEPRRRRLGIPGLAWRGTPRTWAGGRLRPPESSPGPGPPGTAASGPSPPPGDRRGREPEAEPRKTALDLPATPETPPAPTAWPPPPPFVRGHRPREAAETAPAFHTALAYRCVSGRRWRGMRPPRAEEEEGALGRLPEQYLSPGVGPLSTHACLGGQAQPASHSTHSLRRPQNADLGATALPPGGRASLPGVVRAAGRPAWLSVLPEAKSSTSCKHYEMTSLSLVFLYLMCGLRQLLFFACGPGPPKAGGTPAGAGARPGSPEALVPSQPCHRPPGLPLLSRPPGLFPPHGP